MPTHSQQPPRSLLFDENDGTIILPTGDRVALRLQTAQVLRILVAQRGQIVSRDTLLNRVWPTTTVTEDSITQCIAEIRKALGEDGHRLLRTFPKRGYMVDGDLSAVASVDSPADASPTAHPEKTAETTLTARKRRMSKMVQHVTVLAIAVVVVVGFALRPFFAKNETVPDLPRIVVLPFQAVSQTETWSRIGAGLASEISAALAKNDWIEVSQQPDGGAEERGTLQYQLEGTIASGPSRVRLTAKFVDARNGQILWSEVWAGSSDKLFDMQASLLEKVEASVASAWTGVIAQDRLARIEGSPRNLGAYDLYLRAIEQKHRFTPEALAKAQRYLEQALEFDPDYARVWTALAIVHLLQMEHASNRDDFVSHLKSRIEATEKAVALSPGDPETLIQATFLYGRAKKHVAAEAALRQAVESGWNNPDILAQAAWGGSRRVPVGQDAIDWARRALELNKSPPAWYYAGLGTAAFYAEDYELAVNAYTRSPQTTEVLYRRAAAEWQLNNISEARANLVKAIAGIPVGMTIQELEFADGNTYPEYVQRLSKMLAGIGAE